LEGRGSNCRRDADDGRRFHVFSWIGDVRGSDDAGVEIGDVKIGVVELGDDGLSRSPPCERQEGDGGGCAEVVVADASDAATAAASSEVCALRFCDLIITAASFDRRTVMTMFLRIPRLISRYFRVKYQDEIMAVAIGYDAQ
jgi:hypothetical protein